MTKSRGILKPRAVWTPEREQLMRDLYPHVSTKEVAEALGVGIASVYGKANSMGLHKTDAFLASDLCTRIKRGQQHPAMVASQWKPGLTPWNKGAHFVAGGRSGETRFKAGQMPHSNMPIGSYRVVTNKNGGRHLERKTSDAKGSNYKRWTPVARLVWIAVHGPVPQGHIVVFTAGMHTTVLEEITALRVECITRAENAHRNSHWRSDPEIAKLHQLKGAITRQVNRIQKETS